MEKFKKIKKIIKFSWVYDIYQRIKSFWRKEPEVSDDLNENLSNSNDNQNKMTKEMEEIEEAKTSFIVQEMEEIKDNKEHSFLSYEIEALALKPMEEYTKKIGASL